MKISDEAYDAARAAALGRWYAGSADTTQMLLSVFAGIEAMLPYLERSDSEELPAPSAMPDREALVDAIGQATGHVAEMDQHEEGEWENGCASCANWGYPCATLSDAADAVLALLNGSESHPGDGVHDRGAAEPSPCLGDGVCTNPKCPVHGIKEEQS